MDAASAVLGSALGFAIEMLSGWDTCTNCKTQANNGNVV